MKSIYKLIFFLPFLLASCNQLSTDKPDFSSKKLAASADCTPENGFTGIKTFESVLVNGHFKKGRISHQFEPVTGGFEIIPHVGLGTWAAFTSNGDSSMFLGYLVIPERDLPVVEKEIPAHGFSIQDIHTYGDRNRSVVVFIHLIGFGDKQSLATNAAAFFAGMQKNKYLDGKKTTITPANLNPTKLDSIIGINGEILENIYQYRFGQASASNGRPTLSHPPGYQSWAAWQGTDDLAVVTGNFTMHSHELAPVIKALAENGIELVYNHLVHENPDIFFLHYWGVGNAEQLAKGLRAGLDAQR